MTDPWGQADWGRPPDDGGRPPDDGGMRRSGLRRALRIAAGVTVAVVMVAAAQRPLPRLLATDSRGIEP